MATTLRTMLKANHQPDDIPLWISEVGAPAPIRPDDVPDKAQAAQLAKAYLLAIASGFKRVFWFEARGPSYGNGTDLGLIRSDMTPPPLLRCARRVDAHARLRSRVPRGGSSSARRVTAFCSTRQDSTVLAAWAPGTRDINVAFDGNVQISTLAGEQLPLTGRQVLLAHEHARPDQGLARRAGRQGPVAASDAVSLGRDRSGAAIVSAQLKAANVENGVRQVRLDTTSPMHNGAEPTSPGRTGKATTSISGWIRNSRPWARRPSKSRPWSDASRRTIRRA